MTTFYSLETAGVGVNPQIKINDVAQRGRVKILRNTITLAAQAIADNIYLGKRPAGSRFKVGWLTSTVTLSTSTIAIGTLAATGKYRTAAVFTAVDTPTPFGLTAAMALPVLTADEDVYATIAALALPASGTLIIDLEYIES